MHPPRHWQAEARPPSHQRAQQGRKELGNPNNHLAGRRLGQHARNPPRHRHMHNDRLQGHRPSPVVARRGRRRVWNGQQALHSYFEPPERSQARHGLRGARLGVSSAALVIVLGHTQTGHSIFGRVFGNVGWPAAHQSTRNEPNNETKPGKSVASDIPRESGGEDGIRTHDTLLGYTHLANGRFRPLSHLSRSFVNSKEGQ